MNQRMLLLMILVSVLLGIGFCLLPSIREQEMIHRLQGSGQRADDALVWLVKHQGVEAFELAYTHGSSDIHRRIPWVVCDLYVSPHQAHTNTPSNLLGRRLTKEETLGLLLRGLRVADQETNGNAAYVLKSAQLSQPLLTSDNIDQLLPLLDKQFSSNNYISPLWSILEYTPDHAMLNAIPDSVFLQALTGRYPGQASQALIRKYETRPVRWQYGTAGAIKLPNSLLLALMQSPYINAQITASQQLACNYDAVATHNYASKASSDPLHGNSADILMRYSGPPLRGNLAVEKAMGISTDEVIRTLDGIFTAQPDGHFPENAACGPIFWKMLTGKYRT